MNQEKLQAAFLHLIDTYVADEELKQFLLPWLEDESVPAKAILARLEPHMHGISPADVALLQEIVYHYV